MKLSTLVSSPDVGQRIRELRKRRKLSQRLLAEPRYDGSFVSQIEAGRRSPSPDALAYFAMRLGVSVEELAAPVPPSVRVELEVALAQARAAYDAGEPEQAREGFDRLRSLATGYSPEFEAEAVLGLGEIDERAGRISEAIDGYVESQRLAESEELRLRVGLALGRAYRAGGDLAYSIDVLEDVLARAVEHGWLVEAVRAAAFLGATHSERGDHNRARRVLESVSDHIATLSDPRALAAWHWVRGSNAMALGKAEDALKHLMVARGIYERHRASIEIARLDGERAYNLMAIDRHAEAIGLYASAIARLGDAGVVDDVLRMKTELARAHLMLGRRDDARRIASEALEGLRRVEDPLEEANCSVVLAVALGDDPHAEDLLTSAVAVFTAQGAGESLARALQALGEYYVLVGRQADALATFRSALQRVVSPG